MVSPEAARAASYLRFMRVEQIGSLTRDPDGSPAPVSGHIFPRIDLNAQVYLWLLGRSEMFHRPPAPGIGILNGFVHSKLRKMCLYLLVGSAGGGGGACVVT